MPDKFLHDLERLLPGVIGSIGALLWIKGTWPRRIAMVGLGSAASYYGAQHVSALFGMEEGFLSCLCGSELGHCYPKSLLHKGCSRFLQLQPFIFRAL